MYFKFIENFFLLLQKRCVNKFKLKTTLLLFIYICLNLLTAFFAFTKVHSLNLYDIY